MIATSLVTSLVLLTADVGIRSSSGVGVERLRADKNCVKGKQRYTRATLKANPPSGLFESGSCLYVRVANGRQPNRAAEYVLCLGETDQHGHGDFALTDVVPLDAGDPVVITVDILPNSGAFAEIISGALKGVLKLVAGQVPAIAGLDDVASDAVKAQLKTGRENLGSAVFATQPSSPADACLVASRPYLVLFNGGAATEFQLRDGLITDKRGRQVDDLSWLIVQFEEVNADEAWFLEDPNDWRAFSGADPKQPDLAALMPSERESIEGLLSAVRPLLKQPQALSADQIQLHRAVLAAELASRCAQPRARACAMALNVVSAIAKHPLVSKRLELQAAVSSAAEMAPCSGADSLWRLAESQILATVKPAVPSEAEAFLNRRDDLTRACIKSSDWTAIRDERVRRLIQLDSAGGTDLWVSPPPVAAAVAADCQSYAQSAATSHGLREHLAHWCKSAADRIVELSANHSAALTLARHTLISEASAMGVTLLFREIPEEMVAPFVRRSVGVEFSIDISGLRAVAMTLNVVRNRYERIPTHVTEFAPPVAPPSSESIR